MKSSELKKIREELGLSQKKVADATGINTSDISKFENGRLILRDEQMAVLIDYYRENGADISDEDETLAELEQIDLGPMEGEHIPARTFRPQPAMRPGETLLNPAQQPQPAQPRPGIQTRPVMAAEPQPKPDATKVAQIDGIVLPEGMDRELAENLMSEYHQNKQRIRRFLNQPVPRTFLFGDISMTEVVRNVLVPMAENFAIIDQIHGEEPIAKWDTVDSTDIHMDGTIGTYKDAVEHLFTTPLK